MKLKKSSVEAASESGSGGAFIAARFRNPAEEMAAGPEKGEKAAAIASVVTMLLLAVIAALSYMSWDVIKTA